MKALVGAFSVITNLHVDLRFKLYHPAHVTRRTTHRAARPHELGGQGWCRGEEWAREDHQRGLHPEDHQQGSARDILHQQGDHHGAARHREALQDLLRE